MLQLPVILTGQMFIPVSQNTQQPATGTTGFGTNQNLLGNTNQSLLSQLLSGQRTPQFGTGNQTGNQNMLNQLFSGQSGMGLSSGLGNGLFSNLGGTGSLVNGGATNVLTGQQGFVTPNMLAQLFGQQASGQSNPLDMFFQNQLIPNIGAFQGQNIFNVPNPVIHPILGIAVQRLAQLQQPILTFGQNLGQGIQGAVNSVGQFATQHPYMTTAAVGGMMGATAICPNMAGLEAGMAGLALLQNHMQSQGARASHGIM